MKKEKVFHRYIKNIAAMRFNSWWLSAVLHRADRISMTLTGGRIAVSTLLTGIPFVELITIGAKSGLERKSPLFAIIDGDSFILIASSFGRKNNPAWYYNLKATPMVKLVYKGKTGDYEAREAEGDERETYWQQAVQVYEGYQNYAEWASHREIPMMILDPVIIK